MLWHLLIRQTLDFESIEAIVKSINDEKEADAASRQTARGGGGLGSTATSTPSA